MIDSQTTNGLEMRWYPVTDEAGRTVMTARWVDVTVAETFAVSSAA